MFANGGRSSSPLRRGFTFSEDRGPGANKDSSTGGFRTGSGDAGETAPVGGADQLPGGTATADCARPLAAIQPSISSMSRIDRVPARERRVVRSRM